MNPVASSVRSSLLGLSRAELAKVAAALHEPSFRGAQVADWVYRKAARRIEQMTNLPAGFRTHLSEAWEVGRSAVANKLSATDGTTKLLLATADGENVETVGLPYADRLSVCVSSQIGCPMRCTFCATGQGGLARNLTAGEIVDQVLTVQEVLERRVSHVVFMGMGEPLLNCEQVFKALTLLNEEVGIAMRHMTVSTVGIVPGMRRLAEQGWQLTLAVSLHAPDDDLRSQLVPVNDRYTVGEVLAACRHYVERTGRRVTLEYVLLKGVNDSEAQASRLAEGLRGLRGAVNLIPFNPVAGLPYRTPEREAVRRFRSVLESSGIAVTQRRERGRDLEAACGQLRRTTLRQT